MRIEDAFSETVTAFKSVYDGMICASSPEARHGLPRYTKGEKRRTVLIW